MAATRAEPDLRQGDKEHDDGDRQVAHERPVDIATAEREDELRRRGAPIRARANETGACRTGSVESISEIDFTQASEVALRCAVRLFVCGGESSMWEALRLLGRHRG